MRIDLHTHSTASDGTDSPAELVAAAVAAGLDVIALTDHDTTGGWAAATAAAEASDRRIELVLGAEISCRRGDSGVHLLAYRFDPEEPELAAELARVRNDRVPRARAMVRRMAEAGIDLTWEQVERHVAPGATVGRPHIADALVAAGVVGSRGEAFAGYLRRDAPYYLPHRCIDPVEAVRLVAAAGGLTVVAHPASHRSRLAEELLDEMRQAGLSGLEVDHPDHDGVDRDYLRGLSRDLDLVATGSSDYHGTGKINRLGQDTTDPEAYAQLIAAQPPPRRL